MRHAEKRLNASLLREHVPIKQGLRRVIKRRVADDFALREHVPIKQGLRQ